MRAHRFYIAGSNLDHDFWLHEPAILHQWNKVLRFRGGQQVVLFNNTQEKLYTVEELKPDEAHLVYVTDFKRRLPTKDVYLLWSLLKKDKNDWVLQKCTELGVNHFVPLLADRSEKTGFNIERAQKIIIEAAEQCGRSNIPSLRQPINVQTAITELQQKITLLVCQQSENNETPDWDATKKGSYGVLVGPEGGWSDAEKQLFTTHNLSHININDFTLRAETACVSCAAKLLQ